MKLINGDVLEELSKLDDGSVDCIITSPPYWKGFEYEAYFNSYYQYIEWSSQWLRECKRVLAPYGTFYLNVCNDSETTVRAFELLSIATRNLMFKLHDTIIWYVYNRQPHNTDRQLTNQTEYLFMLRNTSANVHLNKKEAYEYNKDIFKTRNVGNVWEIPFNKGDKVSFAKKEVSAKWGHSGFPLALVETCVLLSTNKGDVVLDCFMGSGTTGVVCKELERDFIGIELDKDIYRVASERIDNVQSRLL